MYLSIYLLHIFPVSINTKSKYIARVCVCVCMVAQTGLHLIAQQRELRVQIASRCGVALMYFCNRCSPYLASPITILTSLTLFMCILRLYFNIFIFGQIPQQAITNSQTHIIQNHSENKHEIKEEVRLYFYESGFYILERI